MCVRRWTMIGISTALLVLVGALVFIVQGQTPTEPRPIQTGEGAVSSQAGEAIVIDHTCTDLEKIPDYWLQQAQTLAIHYGHTSHGGQIVTGLEKLESVDPTYAFYQAVAGAIPPPSDPCLEGELCEYDVGSTPDSYWKTPSGRAQTQSIADTGYFDYSMFSWCGEQSYNTEADVQDYLDTMAGFESSYPGMRFILMTGHTDGGSPTLARNNDMVRQYAHDNGMVLFDFADIETYDPLGGGPYDNDSEANCEWCVDFCDENPTYCEDLPTTCAHSNNSLEDTLFCKLKANAFWWMMARLAGWDGDPNALTGDVIKQVTDSEPRIGDRVTYTVSIQNLNVPPATRLYLTDDLPARLSYIPGSLTADRGIVTDTAAPLLEWSWTVSGDPQATITYAVIVEGTDDTPITNQATFSAAGYGPLWTEKTITPDTSIPPLGGQLYKGASKSLPRNGDILTYTIAARDLDIAVGTQVKITDVLPSGLSYVGGSLTADRGIVTDTAAPLLEWSWTVSGDPQATITYAAIVEGTDDTPITNRATLLADGYGTLWAEETITPDTSIPSLGGHLYKRASQNLPMNGDILTYTIVARDLDIAVGTQVRITDVLPSGLSYVGGSLMATSGVVTDTATPLLEWSGPLGGLTAVTITYQARVTTESSMILENTATASAYGYQPTAYTKTVIANGYGFYLPIVLRQTP